MKKKQFKENTEKKTDNQQHPDVMELLDFLNIKRSKASNQC